MADLVAYSGYKFVTILCVQAVALTALHWSLSVAAFLYFTFALGLFVLRSLRYIILPSQAQSDLIAGVPAANPTLRKNRVYFLFIFALLQTLSVWWLVR